MFPRLSSPLAYRHEPSPWRHPVGTMKRNTKLARSAKTSKKPSHAARLRGVYRRLLNHFGPQHWWPGESDFEVIVGAVLTQNTSWRNVERAIDQLRKANVLTLSAMVELPMEELAELIRSAGYYRLKARRLRNMLDFVTQRYGGSLDTMFATEHDALRSELLAVNGIGPETADSILLYAGNKPTFVVDAYTQRVLKRHGWIEPEADYHATKHFLEKHLRRDVARFNEFHALFVRVGNRFCRKQPKCDACPLAAVLPRGGPHKWP